MFLQVTGVVAGVAGAWYAFKQYPAVPGVPGMLWVVMAEADFNGPSHRIGSGLIFGAP